jgi:hypothetical protein
MTTPRDPVIRPMPAGLPWRKRVLYRIGLAVYRLMCARGRHLYARQIIGPDVHGRPAALIPGYRCRLCGVYLIEAKEL